jgi:hypothetical protein
MEDWCVLLRGGHGRSTGIVHEVMPANADARAEEHREISITLGEGAALRLPPACRSSWAGWARGA